MMTPHPTPPAVGPYQFADELIAAASRNPALCRASLALRVLADLASKAARTGTCYRSLARLAETYATDRRSVRRALALLERHGYIARELRPGRKVHDFALPIDPEMRRRPEAPGPEPRPSHFGGRLTPASTSGGVSPPPTSGGVSPPPTSGGVSPPPTSGGVSPPVLRGASHPPEPYKPSENQKSNPHAGACTREEPDPEVRPRFAQDPGPRTRRPQPPEPAEGASCEELVSHAVMHGTAVAARVVARLADRLGLSAADRGLVGQHLWPVVRGEVPADRLLRAARWADRRLDPRMTGTMAARDGFLLMASGKPGWDQVPWPVARASEAAAVAEGSGPRRKAERPVYSRPAALNGMPSAVEALAEGAVPPPPRLRPTWPLRTPARPRRPLTNPNRSTPEAERAKLAAWTAARSVPPTLGPDPAASPPAVLAAV